MAFRKNQGFDAPIPGQSLTHELGNRPWQTPAQYTTIEEALEFYIPRLSNPSFLGRMLDIVERGIPLTALAETITLGGVMQGLHSVDVAVLINPIIVEFMEGASKKAGIKYTVGDTDEGENTPDGLTLSKAMANLDEEEPEEEETSVEEETSDEPKGLMARRGVASV